MLRDNMWPHMNANWECFCSPSHNARYAVLVATDPSMLLVRTSIWYPSSSRQWHSQCMMLQSWYSTCAWMHTRNGLSVYASRSKHDFLRTSWYASNMDALWTAAWSARTGSFRIARHSCIHLKTVEQEKCHPVCLERSINVIADIDAEFDCAGNNLLICDASWVFMSTDAPTYVVTQSPPLCSVPYHTNPNSLECIRR